MEHYIITKNLQLYNTKDKTSPIPIQYLDSDTSYFLERFGLDVSDAEKNLFSANVSAWKSFYETSSEKYCVITEEGVDLQTDLKEMARTLREMDSSWHVFFPYDKIHSSTDKHPISVSRFGFFWGTYCYFIHRDAVPILLQACQNITAPLDEVLLEKGINKDIKFICAETKWYRYDQSKSGSLLARKESVTEYVRSYCIWEDDEIEQVRNILQYLSTVADEIGVKIFLHAGTLLGAIRHGKIMDWDDDVDLMIDSKDSKLLIDRIDLDGKYNVTEWEWTKTGKTYYKIWKPGGFKVEGYEYTFPFVDIWLVDADEETQSAETNDGYTFRYDTYYPLSETVFEKACFYLPHKSEDILNEMYKGWREEIKIFSWSHKLKQHAVRQMTAFIETDKNGRFLNFK